MAELETYADKRDFAATPEPTGAKRRRPRAKGPRFVIQEHHATALHWDFRLERDGVLVSWAVPRGLPLDPKTNHLAVHTEDHPLDYYDFEGEIPAGEYGGGRVVLWDQGTYDVEKWTDREVKVVLHGRRSTGRYVLFQTDGKSWMVHRMDPPPEGWAPLPETCLPMLATSGLGLPVPDEGWAYELKWDGVRALVWVSGGRATALSRNSLDLTGSYPELSAMAEEQGQRQLLLDGELVVFDAQGRSDFGLLQQRMKLTGAAVRRAATAHPVVFLVFDVLHLDGVDVTPLPYAERRELLDSLALAGPSWQTPPHFVGDGAAVLAASRERGYEGIVAKRLDSAYTPGRRSEHWRKVKNVRRQEMVIGGWTEGEGRRAGTVGALLLGVQGDDGLRFAGHVGTGFTDRTLDELRKALKPLRRKDSPFITTVPRAYAARSTWVEPVLVCEVEFAEWTRDGKLRHPSFKGLRHDKDARDVVRGAGPEVSTARTEVTVEVEGKRMTLSNLGKVMYPEVGFTKGQVIDYYTRISPVLLPHLRGRPLTLKRYPDGVDGPFFYEKNCPDHRPRWVKTHAVWSESNGRDIDYCLAQDLPTLVWAANLADLEMHTTMALARTIQRPTAVVFDLDPGAPADIVACCRVGLLVRDLLAGEGLECFAKTSGSKGLQVYVPLNRPTTAYDRTTPYSKRVAERLEKAHPDLVVSKQRKDLRGGKVLVDWSQNVDSKTTVAVYSLRARPRPTVSTPVTWAEVEACAESGRAADLVFETDDVLARVEELGDLFAPVLELVQSLPRA